MEILKSVEYRGGLASFRIPASWVEEYEPEGGGTFYGHRPNSGTLRLNILTFQGPANATVDVERALARSREATLGNVRRLGPQTALLTYSVDTEDSDGPLRVYWWELAHAPTPNHLRLALFSFSVGVEDIADPETASDLRILESELPATTFASELGI